MPSRIVAPPDLSTRSMDNFLGMVRDRRGPEQLDSEFRTLLNWNSELTKLSARLGTAKYGGLTDAAGTKVQGLFHFVDPTGNSRFIKAANGLLRQLYSGAWSDIGTNLFADALTWFAQLSAKQTGAAAAVTGTVTATDATSVTDGALAMTVNAHVGKILEVSGMKKVIIANTATQILVAERFDETPSGSFSVYPRQQELYVATGSQFYKCDPHGATPALTRLDNAAYGATTFNGICTHARRLWGWKDNRLSWSDAGNGENFSRNAWKDMLTPIQCCADLGEVLVVYERRQVSVKFNDNPDQFVWKTALAGYGTIAPKSVGTFPGGLQFCLDERLGVMVINTAKLSASADEQIEPVSASDRYINDHLFTHSAAELAAASGYCDGKNYYLSVGSDLYVLHVDASLDARASFGQLVWVWSLRSYPAAIRPNVIGQYGADLVFGGGTTGQVYHADKAGQYTDDGTAIEYLIEKCDWNVTRAKDEKSYDALYVSQEAAASALTMEYSFKAGGESFDASPDISYNQNAPSQPRYQEIKIPGNPSQAGGKKDSGRLFSFKLRAQASVAVPDIEEMELHFYPSIVS